MWDPYETTGWAQSGAHPEMDPEEDENHEEMGDPTWILKDPNWRSGLSRYNVGAPRDNAFQRYSKRRRIEERKELEEGLKRLEESRWIDAGIEGADIQIDAYSNEMRVKPGAGYRPPIEEWIRINPEEGIYSPEWNPVTNQIVAGNHRDTPEQIARNERDYQRYLSMPFFQQRAKENNIRHASTLVENVNVASELTPTEGVRLQRHMIVNQVFREVGRRMFMSIPFKYRYELTWMDPIIDKDYPSRDLIHYLYRIGFRENDYIKLFTAIFQLSGGKHRDKGDVVGKNIVNNLRLHGWDI